MWRNFAFLSLIIIVFLIASCDDPGIAAYHRGNHAYSQGDLKKAFPYYLFAANDDIVPAQYAVGYQYFYGKGTKRDESKGIKWFERAAPHSLRARYALDLIRQNAPRQPWTFQLKRPN
ncbi:MAG: hypothetical protein COY58_02665 [Gammaproteobacteria bacterium CG_4_10_14_0_8_um_filter_38_16]|nr:MAG: hypothetical protein COY58_02665 [Gammaproteobacteria bacterium CG_4_10_14_0_8_um_filter_38_16]PJA03835.1 MAG: hypothetical protein COX72_02825 [Gammaproteobacteria bacterium CG_4_10_14_0_2_um_filter_38_22]PJB10809.1 MAG: hypothetical protein CO120_02930 [Gammaproteobacteria bacterium CG_4_9_14_3_um_filter_38_9]